MEPAHSKPAPRTMSLDLMGQRFDVVSDEDEGRVREVVAFLNGELERVRKGTRRVQNDQIALLTALNIAGQLFEERARSERLRDQVRERSTRLLASIDAVSRDLDARLQAAARTAAPASDTER